MRINKRASLPILVLIVIMVVTTVLALRVRTQSIPAENKQQGNAADYRQRFPTVEYEEVEDTDPVKRARRMAKNQRYDRRRLVKSNPNKSGVETTRVSEWEVGLPAIPSARSHTVILGDVSDGAQARLSNDKSGVYSEFSVRVVRVFKNLSNSLSPGDAIMVEREGGYVRYSNDFKRLYRIQGQGMPVQGRRDVLFLSATESSTDYEIITGYELLGGKVTPLDSPDHFAIYNNRDETTFLRIVKESLTQPE